MEYGKIKYAFHNELRMENSGLIDEALLKEGYYCACGEPIEWDYHHKDMCMFCLDEEYLRIFEENGLIDGWNLEKVDGKMTYFVYDGLSEKIFKMLEEEVGMLILGHGTYMFPYELLTYDKEGRHLASLGITKGFGLYLICKLNMIEEFENTKTIYYNNKGLKKVNMATLNLDEKFINEVKEKVGKLKSLIKKETKKEVKIIIKTIKSDEEKDI